MSVYERDVEIVSFDEVSGPEIVSFFVRISFEQDSGESDVRLPFSPQVNGRPAVLGTEGFCHPESTGGVGSQALGSAAAARADLV